MVSLGDDFFASVDTCSAVVYGAPRESGLQIVRLILALPARREEEEEEQEKERRREQSELGDAWMDLRSLIVRACVAPHGRARGQDPSLRPGDLCGVQEEEEEEEEEGAQIFPSHLFRPLRSHLEIWTFSSSSPTSLAVLFCVKGVCLRLCDRGFMLVWRLQDYVLMFCAKGVQGSGGHACYLHAMLALGKCTLFFVPLFLPALRSLSRLRSTRNFGFFLVRLPARFP